MKKNDLTSDCLRVASRFSAANPRNVTIVDIFPTVASGWCRSQIDQNFRSKIWRSDKRGSDKRGSDKRGSDKRGSDKRGTDKRGSTVYIYSIYYGQRRHKYNFYWDLRLIIFFEAGASERDRSADGKHTIFKSSLSDEILATTKELIFAVLIFAELIFVELIFAILDKFAKNSPAKCFQN